MTYNSINAIDQGGTQSSVVADLIAQDTLELILQELRILNVHLAKITDLENIEPEEN